MPSLSFIHSGIIPLGGYLISIKQRMARCTTQQPAVENKDDLDQLK